MHIKHIENLLSLSPHDRYEYFVRECVEWEKIWGIVTDEDNWLFIVDGDGNQTFPVWPRYELAEECMFKEHREMNGRPQSIDIYAFIDECIPDMENQKIAFGIFYDKNRIGIDTPAPILRNSLVEALREHEEVPDHLE